MTHVTNVRRPGPVLAALLAVLAGLAAAMAPALLVAGEYDVALAPDRAAEYAWPFPAAELSVQPGGGHHPWRDGPERFVQIVTSFLTRTAPTEASGPARPR